MCRTLTDGSFEGVILQPEMLAEDVPVKDYVSAAVTRCCCEHLGVGLI